MATYFSRATKAKKTPDEIRPAPNIAAIDFGSSSVSLAYSINGDNEVKTLKLHSDYERVPNAILIRKEEDGKFTVEQFGQNAQEKYRSLQQSDKKNFVYFERIKILLKRSENIDRKTTVESLTDGKYYLVEVIAFIITYLKELLLKKLPCSEENYEYKSTDFDWVITVPAIWKARAKRMMREAAYMAGLTSDNPGIAKFTPFGNAVPRPPETNPDKLFLALEPEVAAIFTQSEVKEPAERLPPQRYMVVDIGGGTVDITVHDQGNGKVDVIIPPTGNMWGGITVNQACERLLGTIFEDEGFQLFSKKYPNDIAINDLVFLAFEEQKKIFGNKSDINSTDSFSIQLPYKVINLYTEDNIRSGAQSIEANYEEGKIFIRYDVVRKTMFQPTVDRILECINEAMKPSSSAKVDTVYVVGGFGGCEFMYSAIHSALTKHKGTLYDNIFRPHLPDLAVVKGAVMWRQDPSIIQSRKADATYGMCYSIPFIHGTHDVHYRKYDFTDRINRCTSVFKVFIEKGEMAGFNDLYTATGYPVNETDTVISVPIYSTSEVGVKYVKDKEEKWTVQEIGKLIIEVPNPRNIPNIDRIVDYTMSFSDTEIHAKAKYRVNNNEVKIVCDFLSHQDKQTS
jgi:ankyrin